MLLDSSSFHCQFRSTLRRKQTEVIFLKVENDAGPIWLEARFQWGAVLVCHGDRNCCCVQFCVPE